MDEFLLGCNVIPPAKKVLGVMHGVISVPTAGQQMKIRPSASGACYGRPRVKPLLLCECERHALDVVRCFDMNPSYRLLHWHTNTNTTVYLRDLQLRTYPIKSTDIEPPLSLVAVTARHGAIAMERHLLLSSVPRA